MNDATELFNTVVEGFKVLGPFAGMYFAARVIISYQKDLLGSLTEQNTSLRDQLNAQDTRIEHLEGLVMRLRREQIVCERRNGILIDAVQRAGIDIPPLPEFEPMSDFTE